MRAFDISLSWPELLKRTLKETNEDEPAILFLLALASFFPLTNFIGKPVAALRPLAPADVLNFLEEQLRRLSNANSGGILTSGILGAIWSSSAAVVAIIGSLNRASDIDEGAAAARAYKERIEQRSAQRPASSAISRPTPAFQAMPSWSDRRIGLALALSMFAARLWNRVRRPCEEGA